MDNIKLLKSGAKEFGVDLNDEDVKKLLRFMDLVKDWNQRINLTSIENDEEFIIKHYIDSFSICKKIRKYGLKIIDIGTGAGFPGIPAKIAMPKNEIHLVDSLKKRIGFIEHAIRDLKLKDVYPIHARAEELGINAEYREKFDVCVSRAVAAMPVLLEYCLPFVKLEGIFVAMKGSNCEDLEESKNALMLLGGEIIDVINFILPFSDIKRTLVIVKKVSCTPQRFPRKAGKVEKNPL